MISKRSNTASAKGRGALCVPVQKVKDMEEVSDNGRSVPDGLSPFGSSQQAVSPVPASIPSADATFLRAAAKHFERLPTNGEDSAHWANVYNAMNCRRIANDLEQAHANSESARTAAARCIAIARETRDGFLSEEYAVDQPLSSFQERFACDQVAQAIENEFAMGTIEQCLLLGKPTPFERYRDSDGSGEADKTGTGLAVGDSAGPKDIAQGDAA